MADLADLIKQLEAAKAGSRKLDEAILLALYPAVERRGGKWYLLNTQVRVEPYTRSLDAALTLMPKLTSYPDVAMTCAPQLTWTHTGTAKCNVHATGLGIIVSDVEGATPELALCIGALRARKTLDESASRVQTGGCGGN